MPTTLIDIHPHVISTDTKTYPLAPIGGHQSDWSQHRPVSYDEMIAAMHAAGIGKSAVVQASSAYAYDNRYVAAAVAAHPGRFTGVFCADILAPDAVATMKHWMSQGLTGMRLYTSGSTMPEQGTWFVDPRTYPAWAFAAEVGLPVCMQMRVKGFPQLREILDRFPTLKVIIDHFGRAEAADGPPFAAAAPLFELARYPNVYLKLTHRPIEESRKGRATPETYLGKVVQAFGASRIAWGSNYPASSLSLPELIALAREAIAFLPQQDQDFIFCKTAQTLYPALADKP